MEAIMKAIRIHEYGGPEQLRYEETPEPQAGSGQVLVRVHAASVNPIDHKLASGAMRQFMPLSLPWIPGGDFSGIVEAVGAGVTGVKKGDAVYGDTPTGGAYAQLVVAAAGMIGPKPSNLSHAEAASVPLAGQTAWQGLFQHGHLERGQTVLIHGGSGGVGFFAVQLAHWKGAKVLATGSAANLDFLRSLGADQAIDYKATRFESVVKNVDLVLDLIGGETQRRSFGVLKSGGFLIATAQPASEKDAAEHKVHAMMMRMQASTIDLAQLAKLLEAGTIKTIVSKKYPLSQAREAWADILSGHTRGKIVMEIAG
jgi:NADPH:quinone reductase-like Zn-dependent oxidoreductase